MPGSHAAKNATQDLPVAVGLAVHDVAVDAGQDRHVEHVIAGRLAVPLRAVEGRHRADKAVRDELAVEDRSMPENG